MNKDIYYECGEGWQPLIEEAKEIVAKYNEEHPDTNIKFTQIKEKFGILNLYLTSYPKELINKIREIENRSLHICENCGKPVERQTTLHGWIYTLCDDCLQKQKEKFL